MWGDSSFFTFTSDPASHPQTPHPLQLPPTGGNHRFLSFQERVGEVGEHQMSLLSGEVGEVAQGNARGGDGDLGEGFEVLR